MKTIQQPVALKLAEVIDAFDQIDESLPLEMLPRLSAELRRLHEVNAKYKNLLERCECEMRYALWDNFANDNPERQAVLLDVRKATGETE